MNERSTSSPPLRFVASCCRWPDDAPRRALIVRDAGAIRDWSAVRDLASAHRVEGLVADGIRCCEGSVSAAIGEWAAEVRLAMRAQAALEIGQTLRVCEALQGIPFKILKGAPLGVQAYGRAGLKRSWDIDVLVEEGDAIDCAERIAALGYAPSKPPRLLDKDELRRWSSVSKHAGFASSNGMEVELHWRLTSLPGMLSGLGAAGASRMVALLGDRQVPTLSDDANLAYLCIHGASHGWSRLKWLADFSAFVSGLENNALERAVAGGRKLGALHAIAASFLVREAMFGLPVPAFVQISDKAREMADLTMDVIAARNARIAIEDDPAAERMIERIRRLMGDSRGYVPRYLMQRHRGSEIRALVALPKWLDWAYWLIRPYSSLRRLALRLRATL